MNEKYGAPVQQATAPIDSQTYGAPPPPYSPYPQESFPPQNPADPSLYPPIGLQQPPNDAKAIPQQQFQQQPMQQQQQPYVQPVVQVIQGPPSLTALGPNSVRVKCPHCQADINTRVDKDPSMAAYVIAGILFLFGCVCGCCLIPFCMDSCKTSEHYCANCKKFIGRYSKY